MAEQENPLQQEPESLVEAPESVPTALSPESSSEPKGVQEEAVTEAPVQTAIPPMLASPDLSEGYSLDWGQGEGYSLNFSEAVTFTPVRNGAVNKELANIFSRSANSPVQEITPELETQVAEDIKQRRNQTIISGGGEQIQNAQTPEEVVSAVLNIQAETAKPVDLADIRIEALPQLTDERFAVAANTVRQGMMLGQQIDKAQYMLREGTSILSALGDLGELSIPIAGAFTESEFKAEMFGLSTPEFNTVKSYLLRGEGVDEMARILYSLDEDKQAKVGRKMLEMLLEQETAMFENGNSFLIADRLATLRSVITDGAPSFMTDEATTRSTLESVFGILDAGIEVAGLKGLNELGEAAARFLVKRLAPQREFRPFSGATFRNAGKHQDAKNAAQPEKEKATYTSYDEDSDALSGLLQSGYSAEDAAERAMPKVNRAGEDFVEYKGRVVDVEHLKSLRERVADLQGKYKKGSENFDKAQAELDEIDAAIRSERVTPVSAPQGDTVKDVTPPHVEVGPDIAQVADELGFSLFDPKGVDEDVMDITARMLVTDSADVVVRQGKEIERNSGATLKHNPSMTLWQANDIEGSVGTFKLYFGDGNKGFPTKEAAEMAARLQTNMRLPVREINGEWYAEYDWTHVFDPLNDVADQLDTRLVLGNPVGLTDSFYNPVNYLGSPNLVSFHALRERAAAVAFDVEKQVRGSIKKLNVRERTALNNLLEEGDMRQIVWTRTEANRFTGGISDATWQAYKTARETFDLDYEILERRMLTKAVQEGYKSVVLRDRKESVLGIPKNKGDLEVPYIYDTRYNRHVLVSDFKRANDDGVVVQLQSPDVFDGKTYRHIIVNSDDVSLQLPHRVLNYREGHVNRGYKKLNYKVFIEDEIIVDGVTETYKRTVAAARNEGEAKDLVKTLGADPEYSGKTVQYEKSREFKDSSFNEVMHDLELQGFKPNAAKHRGDLLQGADGKAARVDNPLESLAKSRIRIQNNLNHDITKAQKQRFVNTYRDVLVDAKGDPITSYPESLVFKGGVDEDTMQGAELMFNYINSIDSVEKSWLSKMFSKGMEGVEEFLYGMGWKDVGKHLNKEASDLQRSIMSFTTYSVIVTRLLFQVPTNMSQALFVAGRYPKSGTKAMANAGQMLTLYAMRGTRHYRQSLDIVSKAMGYTGQQVEEFLAFLDETGMVKTAGNMDDFVSQVRDEGVKAVDGAFNFSGGALGEGLRKAKGAAKKVAVDTPMKIQEASIKFPNLIAALAEWDQAIRSGKKMDAKAKAEVLMRARRLLQSQNNLDRFNYQSTEHVLSMGLQYMQHVHKMYLDIVLEPFVRGVMGNKAHKALYGKKEASIYAESRGIALRTTAFVASLFGLNGTPIGPVGSHYATNELREMLENAGIELDDDVYAAIQGGAINLMFHNAWDVYSDVTGRMTPAALIDSLGFIAGNLPMIDLSGASGTTSNSLLNIFYAAKGIAGNDHLTTGEQFHALAREAARVLAPFRDAERSWIAKNWQVAPYTNSLSGVVKVDEQQAIAMAFSVPAMEESDMYKEADFQPVSKSGMDRMVSAFIRAMNVELTEHKEAGTLDLKTIGDIKLKWMLAAQYSLGKMRTDEIEWQFNKFMLTEGGNFEKFLQPFIDGKTPQESLENLRVLHSKEQDPQNKKYLERQIKAFEILVESEKKVDNG